MNDIQIIPAILATSEKDYQEKIEKLWESNLFDRDFIQLDLMDGEFVNNKSISPETIKKYPASFKYELHLMVTDPSSWAEGLKEFYQIQRFIVPVELGKERLDKFIGFVRAFTDVGIGFSFNPKTPLALVDEYQSVVESILIMGVEPGFGGQEFLPEALDKTRQVASLVKTNGLDCLVGVDGGVNYKNAKQIVEAGADYLVIGSGLLEGDIDENLRKIQNAIR